MQDLPHLFQSETLSHWTIKTEKGVRILAVNSDDNILGMIRQRTEEEELKQHLKATVGGYSKSSVMGYLAELRQRQQSSCETFNQNMQVLLEEKENLKIENEKLLMQIAQTKGDFLRLAESKKQQEQIKVGATKDNIIYLKSCHPATSASYIAPQTSNNALENEIAVLKNEISKKDTELKKLIQEIDEQKELLALEKHETNKQRDLASEFSATAKTLREELKYIKDTFSEEKFAALNEQIAELTASVQEQDKIISQLNNQAANSNSKIKELLDDNEAMVQSMIILSDSLDVLTIQNEKRLAANKALAQAYEDESKRVVKLINDISEDSVETSILAQKLKDTINHSLSSEIDVSQISDHEASRNSDSKTSIA